MKNAERNYWHSALGNSKHSPGYTPVIIILSSIIAVLIAIFFYVRVGMISTNGVRLAKIP